MKFRILISIVLVILLSFTMVSAEETTSIKVKPGVFYVKFLNMKTGKSPEELLGTDIYRHDKWSEAIRLVTADSKVVEGSYLKTKPAWDGTLKKIIGDVGYWLVIPFSAGEFEMVINCPKVEAGYAYNLSGGITAEYSNGQLITKPSSTPQSSASITKVDKKVKNLSASSGVHVQQQTQGFTQGKGMSLSSSTSMLVKVPLDTVYGINNAEVWYPVTYTYSISVPPPMDFNKQPW